MAAGGGNAVEPDPRSRPRMAPMISAVSVCEKNVQRTYQRGRKALKRASKENARRLKGNTKNPQHLSQADERAVVSAPAFGSLAPAVFKELNRELKTIGQYLGQVRRLAFVADRVSSISRPESRVIVLHAVIGLKGKGTGTHRPRRLASAFTRSAPANLPAASHSIFRGGSVESSSVFDRSPLRGKTESPPGRASGLSLNLTALSRLTELERIRPGPRSSGRRH